MKHILFSIICLVMSIGVSVIAAMGIFVATSDSGGFGFAGTMIGFFFGVVGGCGFLGSVFYFLRASYCWLFDRPCTMPDGI